jgi:hypothetical protein
MARVVFDPGPGKLGHCRRVKNCRLCWNGYWSGQTSSIRVSKFRLDQSTQEFCCFLGEAE